MKTLLFPFFLISVVASAQNSEKLPVLPKADTVKILKQAPVLFLKPLNTNSKKNYKDLYKILTVKPDTSLYRALKEPKIDISKFRIPNPAIPEIPKTEIKKEVTSK